MTGRLRQWSAVQPLLPELSYRRIDRWIRLGYIVIAVDSTKSGDPRQYSDSDVAKLRVIANLDGLTGSGVPAELVGAVWAHLDDVDIANSHPWATLFAWRNGHGWKVEDHLPDGPVVAVALRF